MRETAELQQYTPTSSNMWLTEFYKLFVLVTKHM